MRYTPKATVVCTALFSLLLTASWSERLTASESVDLFSEISNALACYTAAQNAIIINSASSADISYCNKAIRLENLSRSGLAKTYVNRGILRKKLQNNTSALRDYYRARSLGGDTPVLQVNIGNVAFVEEDYSQAISHYNRALSMELKKSYVAYLNRGLAHEQIGDIDAAIDDYRSVLQRNSTVALAQERLQALSNGEAALSKIDDDWVASLSSF